MINSNGFTCHRQVPARGQMRTAAHRDAGMNSVRIAVIFVISSRGQRHLAARDQAASRIPIVQLDRPGTQRHIARGGNNTIIAYLDAVCRTFNDQVAAGLNIWIHQPQILQCQEDIVRMVDPDRRGIPVPFIPRYPQERSKRFVRVCSSKGQRILTRAQIAIIAVNRYIVGSGEHSGRFIHNQACRPDIYSPARGGLIEDREIARTGTDIIVLDMDIAGCFRTDPGTGQDKALICGADTAVFAGHCCGTSGHDLAAQVALLGHDNRVALGFNADDACRIGIQHQRRQDGRIDLPVVVLILQVQITGPVQIIPACSVISAPFVCIEFQRLICRTDIVGGIQRHLPAGIC